MYKIKVDKQKAHMASAQILHAHMQRRTRTSLHTHRGQPKYNKVVLAKILLL